MKKIKFFLSLVLVVSLIISVPIAGFAMEESGQVVEEEVVEEEVVEEEVVEEEVVEEEVVEEEAVEEEVVEEEAVEEEVVEEEVDEEEVDEEEVDEEEVDEDEGKGKGKGKDKAWKEAKDTLESQKDSFEEVKDAFESEKDELEAQIKEAEESGDTELVLELKAQIEEIKARMTLSKQEMKNVKEMMKEIIRNKYTSEELEELEIVSKSFEENYENIKAIPVENIMSKKANFKFDTPPVVRDGRTLVPVRALTEGFGADVDWNGEERKVTITLKNVEIILSIDSNIVYVNGNEMEIDVPSTVFSNRTYVPLRFIVESLNMTIDYDPETGAIEIDDEEVVEEEVVEEEVAEEEVVEEEVAEEEVVEEEVIEEEVAEEEAVEEEVVEEEVIEEVVTEEEVVNP